MLVDQRQRDEILSANDSIVVSASAGSGKTTIMVKKMGIEMEKIKDHRTIAAVTFTVKATGEIKKKAGNQIKKPFVVMTNDSFIENEIIRPFISDAFDKNFNRDYSVEYGERYKFEEFTTGLEQLKSANILGSFEDNKQNFNFRLAYIILERSIAAQEYIKMKYATIFIDEYQDSDYDMHRFFMKLKNDLNIKLFIVGDSKQAIYLWRGAMSNIFDLLKKENFNFYELVTNFRCDKEIENYANLFHNTQYFSIPKKSIENVVFKEYNTFNSFYERRNFIGFVDKFNTLISNKVIDLNKEITIIANFNNDAIKLTELLNGAGYDFVFIPKTPIDEGLPNGYLLKELALYTKNPTYSIYDFIERTNIDERKQTRIDINKIISCLKKDEGIQPEKVSQAISNLGGYLGISFTDEEVMKFCESICNSNYDMAFKLVEEKYKIMTVFASKGLEFEQVISFARYYKIYQNENVQNHYVCVTRAKSKFLMFLDNEDYYDHVLEVANKNGIKDIAQIVKIEESKDNLHNYT
ncbi:UvrD-helicase domain-containing protein [Lysinibacillus fusiformis]